MRVLLLTTIEYESARWEVCLVVGVRPLSPTGIAILFVRDWTGGVAARHLWPADYEAVELLLRGSPGCIDARLRAELSEAVTLRRLRDERAWSEGAVSTPLDTVSNPH
jgi:hypothetical protein